MSDCTNWFKISNVEEIDSPALLIYPDRVEENVRRMIAIAGKPERLWPHVKTHKLPELIRMQISLDISQFKCATIAEAEMVAECGAREVLLAYQPVGPKTSRLIELIKKFPRTNFSALVDDGEIIRNLSRAASAAGVKLNLFLDIDCGMHRTGIEPNDKAFELYELICSCPDLHAAGLHVYDGHISDSDPAVRAKNCECAFAPVTAFSQRLSQKNLLVPRIIAGGTPTFPMHARTAAFDCSPGTCVLWDAGYGNKLHDMDFLHAALVLTRVVSRPGKNRLCLDLGHKAVAAENPHPRVFFLNLRDANAIGHSEEHLVLETERAEEFPIGTCLYGVPRHVCPTVALYSEAVVVKNGVASVRWPIAARSRRLNV